MELDLKQLREIAEAPGVRPGSWNVYDRGIGYEVHDEKGYELTGGMRETFDKADATHIATFDPPTVLALLSRLEQAEQRVALLESGIVAGIVNTSVFTARAIGADVSSVSESILNMGYPALREQFEQTERLLERVRSEAQELADMNEPAGENFLSILDGEQDG